MLNFKNKTMSKIEATIIADSINPQKDRLTSILVTFPRIILAEVNTHRMLSKNTSSSRAIPFEKMVKMVEEDPFIPIAWQENHKGMQGNSYLDSNTVAAFNAKRQWLKARDNAVTVATELNDERMSNVTKQLCNRLLEPFMWTTMLITGSKEGWDNFFELRCPKYFTPVSGEGFYAKSWKELESWHSNPKNEEILENADTLFKLQHNKGQAEIHMMALAECIYDAMNESTPRQLQAGEYHIPFEDKIDIIEISKLPLILNPEGTLLTEMKVKISTAMAARTSYTVIGDEKEIDYERMIELHDKLIELKHLSPLEHCARAMTEDEYHQNIKGHVDTVQKTVNWKDYFPSKESLGWCRNFKGFISYRHIIETQNYHL